MCVCGKEQKIAPVPFIPPTERIPPSNLSKEST